MLTWADIKKNKIYHNKTSEEKEEVRDKYIENVLIPNKVSEKTIRRFRDITDNEIEPLPNWKERVEEWDYKYNPDIIKSFFNRFYIPKALRAQLGREKYTWSNVKKTDVYRNAPRVVDKKYVRKIFLEEIQSDLKKIVKQNKDVRDGVVPLGTEEDRIESLTKELVNEINKRDPELSDNWENIQLIHNFMEQSGARSPEFAKALSIHIDKLDTTIPKKIKGNEWAIIKYLKSDNKDELVLDKDWDLPESWHDESEKVKNIHRKKLVKAEYQEGVESSLLDDPIFNMVIGGGLGRMGLKGLKAVTGYAKGAFDDLLFGLPSLAKGAAKGAKKFVTGKPALESVEQLPKEVIREKGVVPHIEKPYIEPKPLPEARKPGEVPRVQPAPAPQYSAEKNLTGEFARKRAELYGEKSLYEEADVPPLSQKKLKQEARTILDTDKEKALQIVRTEDSPLSIKIADEMLDDTVDQYRETGDVGVLEKIQEITGLASARTKYAGQIIKAADRNILKTKEAGQADRNILKTPIDFIKFMGKEISKFNKLAGRKLFKRFKELPQLTTNEIGQIIKKIDEINLIKDTKKRDIALTKYTRELTNRIPFPMVYRITSFRKSMLLTGPKGIATDVTSNLSHAVDMYLSKVCGATVDNIRSLVTRGERTMAMPKFKEIKNYFAGVKEGIRHGYLSQSLGFEKWDYMRTSYGKGKLAKALEETEQSVFKLRGYIDYPFYKGMEAASIISHARVEAVNLAKKNKLTGLKKTKFVNEHIEEVSRNVPDHIALMAKRDAEMATFRTETDLGKVIRGLLKRKDISKRVNVLGEFVTPFTRTMPSLVSQTAELATGIPHAVIKVFSDAIAKQTFDAAAFAKKMGKGMVGAGAFALGAELQRRGKINVEPAKSEGESALMKTARYAFGMVETDAGYMPLYPLGPLGILIQVGAMYQHYLNETGSFADGVYGALTKGTKLLTQSAYIQTVKNLIETGTGDISPEKFVGRSIQSFVPSIITETAQTIDPKKRRIEGAVEALQSGVPFLREQLEPQVGITGEEIESGELSLNKFFNPLRIIPKSKSPVIKEMLRLRQEGYNTAPSFVGDKKGYDILTQEENTAIWKKQGKYVKKIADAVIDTKEYQAQKDLLKAFTLKNLTKLSHGLAYAEIIQLKLKKIKKPETVEMLVSEIEQLNELHEQMIWELLDSGVISSPKLLRDIRDESN